MSSITTDSVSRINGTRVMKNSTAGIAEARPLSPPCPFRPRRGNFQNANETTSRKIATDHRIAEAVANCGTDGPKDYQRTHCKRYSPIFSETSDHHGEQNRHQNP